MFAHCRKFLGSVLFLALVLASSFAQAADRAPAVVGAAASGTQAKRPNIVLIVTDDQSLSTLAHMPRLQELLVNQGVTFSNAYATTPWCCPARASILRGQYAHNHGVLKNGTADEGFPDFYRLGREESTIATWLQAGGYRTVLIGKYLNAYPSGVSDGYVPPGWDEWYAGLHFDYYDGYDYALNENGQVVWYGTAPEDYQTDVLARHAADSVRRVVADPRPFFMYLAPTAPHGPIPPAPRHLSMPFDEVMAPRPPSFNEADVGDKPPDVRRPLLTSEQVAGIDRHYRRQVGALLAVDDMVALVIETLRETGQLENTFVIFTSDHGYHMGQHRLRPGKQMPYEDDIRVPLIVRGPGTPPGRTLPQLVLNIDLAPTMAELAGVGFPSFVDGRSLRTLLDPSAVPATGWRRAFLVENWSPPFAVLRTAHSKYTEWHHSGARELYDLQKDPYELESQHANADPALLEGFSAELAAFQNCAGPSCRALDGGPLVMPTSTPPARGRGALFLPLILRRP